jgi:hypothetical protein
MGTPQENYAAQVQGQGQVPAAQAPLPPPPPYRLVPEQGTRLADLRGQLEAARAAADEAAARAKQIADAMKSEAVAMAPPRTETIIIAGAPGVPDWNCHWVPSRGLDVKRIKAERRDIYDYYQKPPSGTWKIEKAR